MTSVKISVPLLGRVRISTNHALHFVLGGLVMFSAPQLPEAVHGFG
jgi:hypothetical protein